MFFISHSEPCSSLAETCTAVIPPPGTERVKPCFQQLEGLFMEQGKQVCQAPPFAAAAAAAFRLVTLCVVCRVILSPKKMKHSVVNISLAMVLLLLSFVLGINRTDMQVPCQVTGICLHYFTLAATFWITITSK